MDIIYKKDTLYVYLNESIDTSKMKTLEKKINHIMSTYNIDHLVVRTTLNDERIHLFEQKFNSRHRSKISVR